MSATFNVVAERFRRAGHCDRAVALCQEGLAEYPGHLSARVTLGCALLELGQYADAHRELQIVIKRAPDNLAAIRGLAELHARGIEEQDANEMQASEDARAADDEFDAAAATTHAGLPSLEPRRLAMTPAEMTETTGHDAPAVPRVLALEPSIPVPESVLCLLDDFDPAVEGIEQAAMHFEIEDVIAEAEDADDSGVDLISDLPALERPADPIPVRALSAGPIAVLDEWLTRIRARRSELLSEYAAG